MIDGELFDNLKYLSIARSSRLIKKGTTVTLWRHSTDSCWEDIFDIQMELTHVYRQSDSELVDFLEGIRRRQVDRENNNFKILLNSTSSVHCAVDDNDTETRLFPRTDDVKRVNQERLKSLGKEVVRFNAVDTGSMSWLKQLKYQIAPDQLEIYEGAKVILIKKHRSSHW
ncbi:hypothetical protein ZOSMA_41G00050 [Zostera marina]|uniref:Uncharacterized protein n=1 Tax=Zostera marina TaxID=29655 RepID=A0A0K9P2G5_ZOSMR|nr:hypothetical protein ZOSMA_41G00050 [Zostera marina]